MKRQLATLFCLSLSFAYADESALEPFVEPLIAAAEAPAEEPLKIAKNQVCTSGTLSYVELRHREKQGVGYDKGYTTAATFLTPSWISQFQPFLDVRGHVFNDGKFATNVGIGSRYMPLVPNWALGAGVYYDWRQTSKQDFNQVGFIFESLSPWIDFRLNGYFPVGTTQRTECPQFSNFCGNNAFAKQQLASALANIEGEIGFWIPRVLNPVDVYFAIGPYYLFEEKIDNVKFGDAIGGKARIFARILDGVTVGIDATYDKIFNTRVQGYATISFPFGPGNMQKTGFRKSERYCPCPDTFTQLSILAQPVYRNEIIPLQEEERCCIVSDCNGCPYNIVFVNNALASFGCGTFEQPYSLLKLAEFHSDPCDIIYVCAGDETTHNQNEGIILKNNQLLTSSAVPLQLGPFCIPACDPCSRPAISNPNGTAITLANSNTVTGFNIENSVNGIVGTASCPGTSYCINKNTFTTISSNVINLTLPDSNCAIISDNNFISNPGATAIKINANNNSKAIISYNNINEIGTGIDITAANGSCTSIFDNRILKFSVDGITLNLINSGPTCIKDNVLTGTKNNLLALGSVGINVTGQNNSAINILNTQLSNVTGDGMIFNLTNSGPTSIQNCSLSNLENNGINLTSQNSGSFQVANTQITSAPGDGIVLDITNSGPTTFRSCTLNQIGTNGLNVTIADNSSLNVSNCEISGPGDLGILLSAMNNSQICFTSNHISNFNRLNFITIENSILGYIKNIDQNISTQGLLINSNNSFMAINENSFSNEGDPFTILVNIASSDSSCLSLRDNVNTNANGYLLVNPGGNPPSYLKIEVPNAVQGLPGLESLQSINAGPITIPGTNVTFVPLGTCGESSCSN